MPQRATPPNLILPLWKWLYVSLGISFVFLAVIGVILPLVPTTPFLLLASYFFVRSSPRLNSWLLHSRLFGPILRDWQEKRGVRRSVKFTAVGMIPAVIFSSAYFGNLNWPLLVLLSVLGLIGLIVVIKVPTVVDTEQPNQIDPKRTTESHATHESNFSLKV